jgi:Domain of unknown function (DUF4157)
MSSDWDQDRLLEHEQIRAPEPVEQPAPPETALTRLASDIGNQAFTSTVAREGSGITPSGTVTSDVQDAINTTRGGGSTLDAGVQSRFADTHGDLSDVRVHTDDHADNLNRAVSARAFATGTDVYFSKGEYSPGSAAGDELLAHELTHVVQQRGAPTSGPLSVSNPGDAMETEADEIASQATKHG